MMVLNYWMACDLTFVVRALVFWTRALAHKDRVHRHGMMALIEMLNEHGKIGWDGCHECDAKCDQYGCFDYTAQAVQEVENELAALVVAVAAAAVC